MPEPLRCPKCGAYYTGKVPEWVLYVKCEYCGTSIPVPKSEKISPQQPVVVYVQAKQKKAKNFVLSDFCDFMKRKGYQADAVSGVIKIGTTILYVDGQGNVEGPEPYKSRIENWIHVFLESDV